MKKLYIILIVFIVGFSSCLKDLDTTPLDETVITSASVYETPANYYNVLAKLYAGLAVSGQEGPAGQPDISGIDEGFSTYLRQYWKAQELSTDEAVIAWNDGNLRDYHDMDWTPSNEFVTAMYNRIFYQISLCNEFIRESTDDKLSERNISGTDKTNIQNYRLEARYLRALSYYHALDMFGNVPFVTENDAVGAFLPTQIKRADLYSWLETELKAIEGGLPEPRANEYGRTDKAGVWAVLAKLYLNAEVYAGVNKYTEAATYSEKIINAGYSLEPNYFHNFNGDNHLSSEIIFPVAFDGIHTRTWGGMTFVVHAAVGGSMVPSEFGIDGGWGGTRVTSAFVKKFYPEITEKGLVVSPIPPKSKEYPVLYCPGSYQGWDPTNTTTVLASVNSDGNYEGYFNFVDAGTAFKFTTGPSWDYNWGDTGADGTLDLGGTNIVAADPGYYKINVDTVAKTYTVVSTHWGLIGSSTAGGWDSDQDMTYNTETNMWEIYADLTEGFIKFRANDDWGINLGDNAADGILEPGGADIAIASAGSYKITLKLGAPDYTYTVSLESAPAYDARAAFHTDGQTLMIESIFEFTQGYAVAKFRNITRDGRIGSDLTFPDNDYPVFRLADFQLMYAEAVLRGGTGDLNKALDYVNQIRERAYGVATENISAAELTLDFILDERARELYWEGHRRTDLIRYGRFTSGSYLWDWKGNVNTGTSVDEKYNLFPIPSTDIGANPNLNQNDGY